MCLHRGKNGLSPHKKRFLFNQTAPFLTKGLEKSLCDFCPLVLRTRADACKHEVPLAVCACERKFHSLQEMMNLNSHQVLLFHLRKVTDRRNNTILKKYRCRPFVRKFAQISTFSCSSVILLSLVSLPDWEQLQSSWPFSALIRRAVLSRVWLEGFLRFCRIFCSRHRS